MTLDAAEEARTIGADAAEAVAAADLVYVSDEEPGIRRLRKGSGFSYERPDGKQLRDKAALNRIRALVVPPAWTDVWICDDARGHIQATGRDAKGRKQYIYHPQWREVRDCTKYERMLDFARALTPIRERVDEHMRRRSLPREKVLATIVRLLDDTLIRVGNSGYAEQNKSYGLTTLRDRHAVINGSELRFEFKGKSGKAWRLKLRDRRIARVVKQCQDIPGQHLFQYFDAEGARRPVTSSDVNAYLREVSGLDISTKDFRTWAGTVLAATALRELETAQSETEAKRNVAAAIKKVAARLGNTPAVCRKCYVHPEVLSCYLEGALADEMGRRLRAGPRRSFQGLELEEAAVLGLLQRRLTPQAALRAAA